MRMLSFFTKKDKKLKREGADTTVSSEDLFNEKSSGAGSGNEVVETELSIHPSWRLKDEETYVYRFLNNECPPLKPDQVSLSGIELEKEGEEIRVSAFVRNSLNKSIKLKDTALLLIGPNNERLGRKVFNLSVINKIPPRSARPWHFIFQQSDLYVDELPKEGWKLAFELRPPHELQLEESWEKSLADDDKEKLRKMTEQMSPPKPGEVNFMGLQAVQATNGDLHITMLIRNGSHKSLHFEQIPLHFEDASGEVIAKGGFTLDHFEVKPNTSKPWTFIFPKKMIEKDDIDLSRWKCYPPKQ